MISVWHAASLSSTNHTIAELKADEVRITEELAGLRTEQLTHVGPIEFAESPTPRRNALRMAKLEAALELNLKKQRAETAAAVTLDLAVNPPKRWLPEHVFSV